jgi:hypothetical protein
MTGMWGIWAAGAALSAGAGVASAQLHEADFVIRVEAGALELGSVGPGGAAVFPDPVRSAEFGAEGFANFTNDPGVNSGPGDLMPAMELGFDILAAARKWDPLAKEFASIAPETVRIRDGFDVVFAPPADVRVPGFIFGDSDNDPAAIFHSHVQFFLNFPSSTPVPGVWLVQLEFWTTEPGIAPSGPAYIVFHQASAPGDVDEAVQWVYDELVNGATCAVDLTGDGQVDSGDLSAFISAFLAQDLAADLTGDGQVDSGDLSAFITAFLIGCG